MSILASSCTPVGLEGVWWGLTAKWGIEDGGQTSDNGRGEISSGWHSLCDGGMIAQKKNSNQTQKKTKVAKTHNDQSCFI